MILLAILFLVTAILYSSVGFGGGSTYLALFLIWGIPYFIFPVIALCCNIIVVTGNCYNYIKAGNLNFRLLFPFLLGSIPLSYIGGTLPIAKNLFEVILFFVLTTAGILLLFKFKSYDDKKDTYKKGKQIPNPLYGKIEKSMDGKTTELWINRQYKIFNDQQLRYGFKSITRKFILIKKCYTYK